jgi:malate dehydrogenase
MAYVMYRKLGFNRERVIGYGWLDTGRYRYYLSKKLGVSPSEISAFVIGMHGEKMLPLTRLSTFSGIPMTELISEDEIRVIREETIKAGARIIEKRGFSSNYGPAVGLAAMAKSIYKDSKTLCVGSICLEGEYGYEDVMANVPFVLGRGGAERIIELPLNDEEKRLFEESILSVKKLIDSIPRDLYS